MPRRSDLSHGPLTNEGFREAQPLPSFFLKNALEIPPKTFS